MDNLDQLFQDAAKPVAVPDALMARILADALREQPVPMPFGAAQHRGKPQRASIWNIIADMFGGGGVIAGLASVACAGIYLGAAQPSMIGTLSLALSGSTSIDQLDYMPSIDALLEE